MSLDLLLLACQRLDLARDEARHAPRQAALLVRKEGRLFDEIIHKNP
jgi:hypothetical protein